MGGDEAGGHGGDDLHIVSPTDEDISLAEAARLAGVSPKTIRRAVSTGELPRRYAYGPRGRSLIFWRDDVERWRERPTRRGRRPATETQRLGGHRMRSRGGGEDARAHLRTHSPAEQVPPVAAALLEEITADMGALRAKIDRLRALLPEEAPD